MKFVLIEKLKGLEGPELIMFLLAVAAVVILAVAIAQYRRAEKPAPQNRTRSLIYGALCIALSFALSYIKLISMPLGGSLTLCSMLPIAAYACVFGPACGFLAGFAYSILQIVQGAWVVHWAQFLLDYIFAFTCYGLASFFPKKLPLGLAVVGLTRLLCSTLSGAIFFAEGALEAGWSNAWFYSLCYNGCTVGLEAALCVIVALLPQVSKTLARMKAE